MWDKRWVSKVDSWKGRFLVSVLFSMEEDSSQWMFSSVYGPVGDQERRGLWEELSAIRSRWMSSWCIAGDFNAVRRSSERSTGGRWDSAMTEFSEFIDTH